MRHTINKLTTTIIHTVATVLYAIGVLLIMAWLLYIAFNSALGSPPPVPFLGG